MQELIHLVENFVDCLVVSQNGPFPIHHRSGQSRWSTPHSGSGPDNGALLGPCLGLGPKNDKMIWKSHEISTQILRSDHLILLSCLFLMVLIYGPMPVLRYLDTFRCSLFASFIVNVLAEVLSSSCSILPIVTNYKVCRKRPPWLISRRRTRWHVTVLLLCR